MATDLIFDFFGTLAGYTPGSFNGVQYTRTHQWLLDRGFSVDYDTMVNGFEAACQLLETDAAATLNEFHLDQAGYVFFREQFTKTVSDEAVAEFVETFNREWNSGTVFYPGIQAFVERLARDYRLSIISNSVYPPLVPRNLEAMGVSKHFAQVLTSADFGVRKPDQRIFHEALRRLGIDAADAIYVGDSFETDYRGATSAGLRCVLIDPTDQWEGTVLDRVDCLFDLEHLLEAAPRF
jgi:HAD superfamily hydrolase (TIGR01549 family)